MVARYLISYPCQDACGTVETDERVDGAPVYRCPGCDSEWFELHERTVAAPGPSDPQRGSAPAAPGPSDPQRGSAPAAP